VVRDIASAAVWGKGPDGYRDALDHLAERLA
jgi:3-dehydroquinate dehydratase